MDVGRIEEKLDRVVAGNTAISMSLGGIQFKTMAELFEMAKLMALSDLAVPPHLRGNPGACLAVCTKALRFGFDPFSLAEHSYSMEKNEKGDDGKWYKVSTIAFDSFVIRAIIGAHAPITGQIKYAYSAEGDARICTATVVDRRTGEVLEFTSPMLGQLKAARGTNDKGQIRGSPLWQTKPDQQLAYDTGRDLCRRYFPEILLGWYDKDELEEYGPHSAKDVTPAKPKIAERLKGQDGQRGFSAEHVERETAATQQQSLPAPTEQALPITADASKPEPEKVAVEQQKPLEGNDPGEIPANLKRKAKEPKADKPKDEPKPEPATMETVDEDGIIKMLLGGLTRAKEISVQSKDDGVSLQSWQKSGAVHALREKLSKESNDKIGVAVRAAWEVIT